MGRRLYVGNLPYNTTDQQLRELFGAHGRIEDVHLVMDRETGRPRGFAFVTMSTDAEATAAVNALHDRNYGGRPMVVNEARERGSAPPPRESRYQGGGGSAPPYRDRGPAPSGGGGYRDRPDRPPDRGGDRPPYRSSSGPGGPRPGGGGGYGSRPDGPSGPPRPRPPRMPVVGEGDVPPEEPRRRLRPATPAKREEFERVDAGTRTRPEEDDYASVSNWRQLLEDEVTEGEGEDDLEIVPPVEPAEKAVDEEDDWRRYVNDEDDDDDAGDRPIGRIIKSDRGDKPKRG